MSVGDKIIWDSGFGYDIGYYLGLGVTYNTLLVDLHSGIVGGKVSLPPRQIEPYTLERIGELHDRYGYLYEFND